MRVPGSGAPVAEKDVHHLAGHIERGENNTREHQIMRQRGTRPTCRGMQDFLFRPAAGEKERHAAETQHADGVCQKGDRHERAQPAHFANVLFVMAAMNDRPGSEEEQGLEKAVREQMHDARRNTSHA